MHLGIDADQVAILYDREGAPRSRLWRDMTDHDAVRRARKAAIRNERDVLPEALPDERRAGAEHLWHACDSEIAEVVIRSSRVALWCGCSL